MRGGGLRTWREGLATGVVDGPWAALAWLQVGPCALARNETGRNAKWHWAARRERREAGRGCKARRSGHRKLRPDKVKLRWAGRGRSVSCPACRRLSFCQSRTICRLAARLHCVFACILSLTDLCAIPRRRYWRGFHCDCDLLGRCTRPEQFQLLPALRAEREDGTTIVGDLRHPQERQEKEVRSALSCPEFHRLSPHSKRTSPQNGRSHVHCTSLPHAALLVPPPHLVVHVRSFLGGSTRSDTTLVT